MFRGWDDLKSFSVSSMKGAGDKKILDIEVIHRRDSVIRTWFPESDYWTLSYDYEGHRNIQSFYGYFDGKEEFDYVFCVGVLEHCTDPRLLFKCAYKALKPGGGFVVTGCLPGATPHLLCGITIARPKYFYTYSINDLVNRVSSWSSVDGIERDHDDYQSWASSSVSGLSTKEFVLLLRKV